MFLCLSCEGPREKREWPGGFLVFCSGFFIGVVMAVFGQVGVVGRCQGWGSHQNLREVIGVCLIGARKGAAID